MIMMINNSRQTNYYERKQYIEKTLKEAFEPAIDFEDLEYIHEPNMDSEYIRYSNTLGVSFYLNVTSKEDYQILNDVASIVLKIKPPENVIQEANKIREVAGLFKEAKC